MSLSLLSSAPNVDAMFAFGLALLPLTVSAVPCEWIPIEFTTCMVFVWLPLNAEWSL